MGETFVRRPSMSKPLRTLDGSSSKIRSVRAAIPRIAKSVSTVLLTGETGTGKGVAARLIHQAGTRGGEPFAHVDCAALSPTVVESELFGHERGAFTDAVARRSGRFELAGRGTVFLDEIGELDWRLQAKLLRVLEDREFERVGGVQTLSMNARVIAATHRDLPTLVETGRFRADLFYRLDVLNLDLPPLRERMSDLPRLADALIARTGGASRPVRLSEKALAQLRSHDWPGNVRELANVLERCLALVPYDEDGRAEFQIDSDLVEKALARPRRRGPESARSIERAIIAAELSATGGNVRRTARRLGLPRGTLRYRIQRYSLEHLLPND